LPTLTFSGKQKALVGPSDRLTNIVFIEFIKCEKYFIDYSKTGIEDSLNKLVAILYRPKRTDITEQSENYEGDLRIKYNDHTIERRSKDIAALPFPVRMAVFLFYQGCRESIVAAFPEIFQEPEEGAKPEKGSQGWTDVLINLAGSKFGNMEATAYTSLYTILATLKNNYYQQMQMEELYKSK
jgi:hypothetical protein